MDVADRQDIARLIDHTNLRPNATAKDIDALCREARQHHFHAVCVNPVHVAAAKKALEGSGVKVCSVIAFPFGAVPPSCKLHEAKAALTHGADELDVVANIGWIKERRFADLKAEAEALAHELRSESMKEGRSMTLKIIIETCYLDETEKIEASKIVKHSGAHFVKTSTGYGTGGATVHDVALIRKAVGEGFGIKASGGIKTFDEAAALVHAGATRIGTSNGLQIVGGH